MSDTTRLLILDHYLTGEASIPGGDGSIHFEIFDENDIVLQSLTNVGITENPVGSAIYQVSVPSLWAGMIVWYSDAGITKLAAETFDPESGFQGPNLLTVRFVDSRDVAVPNVTFTVNNWPATTNGDGVIAVRISDGSYTLKAVPTAGVMWSDLVIVVNGDLTVMPRGTAVQVSVPVFPIGDGKRGIKLRRYNIENVSHLFIHGFRLKVDIAEVIGGMEPDIFVYYRKPANPETGQVIDVFATIASFVDMSIYPAGAPDPSRGEPFYRAAAMELDLRSMRDYEEAWDIIVREANALCNAMDKADVVSPVEEQWAGASPGEEPSSESVSVSA